jgi:uncharacterized Zn-binding protein involved in type VI secretion
MPPAARVGDSTTHGGSITGPGVSTVTIGGQSAAVAGDMHSCALGSNTHPPTTPFPTGSSSVTVGGRGVLRTSDSCGCGAMAAVGAPTVVIGG